jgi:hypothetical protein
MARSIPFGVGLCLVLLATHAAAGQDLLDRLVRSRPALTTNLTDTLRDAPWLDPDDDEDQAIGAASLRSLPRAADGAYLLPPGAFEATFESFCLLAGTPGPARGEGYLPAPITGPRASLITGVLDRATQQPDISQDDVQALLWAVLSKTRPSQMPAEMQAVAARLLTAADRASLEADAQGRLTAAIRDQVLSRLPPFAANLVMAEAELREAFAARASYDELARIAVPDGSADVQAGDREIPEGRWALAGQYLVRLLPSSYRDVKVQIMVPEKVDVKVDARGRLTAVSSPDGWATLAEYDDTIAPLRVPGDPALAGYAFKSVTFRHPVGGAIESLTVANAGWTFHGRSNGQGELPEAQVCVDGDGAWCVREAADRYTDAADRYRQLKKKVDRAQPPGSKDVDRLTDLKHYGKGVKDAVGADPVGKAKWLDEHFNRLGRAAAYVLCALEGGCTDQPRTPPRYKPGGTAVPGAQGAQRLGVSGR